MGAVVVIGVVVVAVVIAEELEAHERWVSHERARPESQARPSNKQEPLAHRKPKPKGERWGRKFSESQCQACWDLCRRTGQWPDEANDKPCPGR